MRTHSPTVNDPPQRTSYLSPLPTSTSGRGIASATSTRCQHLRSTQQASCGLTSAQHSPLWLSGQQCAWVQMPVGGVITGGTQVAEGQRLCPRCVHGKGSTCLTIGGLMHAQGGAHRLVNTCSASCALRPPPESAQGASQEVPESSTLPAGSVATGGSSRPADPTVGGLVVKGPKPRG